MFEVAGSFVLIDAAKIVPPALDAEGRRSRVKRAKDRGGLEKHPSESRLQASATTLLPRFKCVHKGRRATISKVSVVKPPKPETETV